MPVERSKPLARRPSAFDVTVYHPPVKAFPGGMPFFSWPTSQAHREAVTDKDANFMKDKPAAHKQAVAATGRPFKATGGNRHAPPTSPSDAMSSLPPVHPKKCHCDATGVDVEGDTEPSGSQSGSGAAIQTGPNATRHRTTLAWKDVALHYTENVGLASERIVHFICSRSSGDAEIVTPPKPASDATPGDVHVHLYIGGTQRWVLSDGMWVTAEIGAEHPVAGAGRVLTHRAPFGEKHPTWVLPESLQRSRARDKKRSR